MNGIEIITAERERHASLGWSPKHDNEEHPTGGLAMAAAIYATPAGKRKMVTCSTASPGMMLDRGDAVWEEPAEWPFESGSFKPTPNNRIRELAKAGALIAAEIDRLQATAGGPTRS
jgi:hypothetical protein